MFKMLKSSELPKNVWKTTSNYIYGNTSICKLKLFNFDIGVVQIAENSNCTKICEVRFFFKSKLLAPILVKYFVNYCENKGKHILVINSSSNELVNEILGFCGLKKNVVIPNYILNGNTYYDLYMYQS